MSTGTPTYSALYAFGDSLSDAGNAWLLTTSGLASTLGLSVGPVSPPYYQETYNSIANTVTTTVTADVFSNGPVWTQDLAASLNLGVLAPSGLGAFANTVSVALTALYGASTAATDVALLEFGAGVSGPNPYIPLVAGVAGGTDYAVGGAVTGPTGENSAATVVDGLSAELATFQHMVPTPAANALATVSIGGNDVYALIEDANFSTLYGTGTNLGNVAITTAGSDIAQSVSLENVFLQSLVATGVTNVVVMNVPDVGQTPQGIGLGTTKAAAGTVLSQYYDSLLAADVNVLNTGTVHVAIVDAFTLIDSAIASPASSGYTNVTSPVYSGSGSSYSPGSIVSTNTAVQDTYLFFDKIHPTEPGQAALASQALAALTCFVAGTRIRTQAGDVPVEDLRPGMRVVLADGGVAPIVWVGHREVDRDRDPTAPDAAPVRFRAGAFGPGMPQRDLYVSPDHAMFVDGVLVPAKYLVDGDAIAREPRESVTYWHVELPRHSLLLAEGLPCESFLDTGCRNDAGRAKPRRADYVVWMWETEGCAELVVAGPRLAAARAWRATRAVA